MRFLQTNEACPYLLLTSQPHVPTPFPHPRSATPTCLWMASPTLLRIRSMAVRFMRSQSVRTSVVLSCLSPRFISVPFPSYRRRSNDPGPAETESGQYVQARPTLHAHVADILQKSAALHLAQHFPFVATAHLPTFVPFYF